MVSALSGVKRKHYLGIAKCIRNTNMSKTARTQLISNLVEYFTSVTLFFDEKAFRTMAYDPALDKE